MAYEDFLLANYATGLKGYWQLGANANDSSTGGNNGTVLNTTPTFGQTGIVGSTAGAARFAANRGLRFEANPSAGASSPFAAAALTLVAWVKRLGAGTVINSGTGGYADIEPIINKGMAQAEGADLDANYMLGLRNSTGMKVCADFEEDDEGSGAYGLNHPITGTVTVTDNVWHMLAATYNWNGSTGSWTLYLDGAACGTLAVNEPPENESLAAFVVGCGLRTTDADTAPQGAWNGDICHVAIWDTALAEADMALLYAAGNPSTPTATLVTSATTLPTQTIVIQLADETSGIDDSTVSSADLVLKKAGVTQIAGVDYAFAYDTGTDRITLTRLPAGGYFNSGSYEAILNPA